MSDKFTETLRKTRVFLEEQFRTLSVFNSRIVFYSLSAYAIVAVHHFFPVLYTLYTFENFTYFLLFQFVLFILYKKAYFSVVLRNYLRQVSVYLEITNIFLFAAVFVGIFLFQIRGSDLSELAGFFIILAAGYIYNSVYKDGGNGTLFGKDRMGRTGTVFLLVLNIGIWFFLERFLERNGLREHVLTLVSVVLVFFDGIALFLFTDTFQRIRDAYVLRISTLPRKTARRIRWIQSAALSFVILTAGATGVYVGYGQYGKMLASKTVEPQPIVSTQPEPAIVVSQTAQEPASLPDGFFPSASVAATGAVDSKHTNNSTGTVVSRGSQSETGTTAQHVVSSGSGTVAVRTAIATLSASQNGTGTTRPASPIKKKVRDVYSFDRYIGVGNNGEDVLQLQKLLKNSGFYKGALTGTFDTATGDALARFLRTKTGTKNSYTQLGPKALRMLNGATIE